MKKFIFVNMNVDNDAYYDELALKKGKYRSLKLYLYDE